MRPSVAVFLLALLPSVAPGAGQSTIRSLKVAPGVSSAKVTWDARPGAGVAGWALEWTSFCGVMGRSGAIAVALPADRKDAIIRFLRPGRVYSVRLYPYVRITAKKTIGRAPVAGQIAPVTFRVGRPGGAKPATVKNLRAAADGARVRLTWDPSGERDVAGYEITRKAPGEDAAKPYLTLTITDPLPRVTRVGAEARSRPAGVAEIVDTGLEQDKEYEYSVRAFTDGDKPQYSDPAGPVTVKTEVYVIKPGDLLFVVNRNAKNARKIALSYARARKIAKPKAVKVNVPVGAEITRQTFTKSLLGPVQRYLARHPRVTFIILVRGIPWRIREVGSFPERYTSWDRASVDSELTLARFSYYPVQGKVRNPLFGKTAKLTPVDKILAVCRLDGPDDKIANDLVRRATAAEKLGVEGVAFFDAGGPYASGNAAILRAADVARKDGRFQVQVDNEKRVIDLSLVKEKIGFYYGWYAGHFRPKRKTFRLGRGAVAAHLHSYAAYAISRDKYWVGPLLAHGATATLGVADEPLLDGFPVAAPLVDALLRGRNFGEASLASSRYLSWMSVNIGDPLYRPFKPKPAEDPDVPKAVRDAL